METQRYACRCKLQGERYKCESKKQCRLDFFVFYSSLENEEVTFKSGERQQAEAGKSTSACSLSLALAFLLPSVFLPEAKRRSKRNLWLLSGQQADWMSKPSNSRRFMELKVQKFSVVREFRPCLSSLTPLDHSSMSKAKAGREGGRREPTDERNDSRRQRRGEGLTFSPSTLTKAKRGEDRQENRGLDGGFSDLQAEGVWLHTWVQITLSRCLIV